MKTNGSRTWRSAVVAVGALLCISASQAFAGLDRMDQGDVPDSWFINFSAHLGSSGLNSAFDNIKLFIGAPVNYMINTTPYSIPSPSLFEDISASSGHKAVEGFIIFNPLAVSTWAQTSIDSTPGGTLVTASGNTISTTDQILNFNVYFQGFQTDGTHFYMEFYNGTTFVTGYEIKDILDPSARDANGVLHPDGFEQTNYSAEIVPLPSAAWMGLAMLGGMGAFAAKRRRDRALLA